MHPDSKVRTDAKAWSSVRQADPIVATMMQDNPAVSLTILTQYNPSRSPEIAYNTFLVVSQVANGLGQIMALWCISRMIFWIAVVVKFLPPRPEKTVWQLHWDASDKCCELATLLEPHGYLLYAACLGALYIGLQKASPSYWEALGIRGYGTPETLLLNSFFVIVGSLAMPITLWVIFKLRVRPLLDTQIEAAEARLGSGGNNDADRQNDSAELQRMRQQSYFPDFGWKSWLLKIILGVIVSTLR